MPALRVSAPAHLRLAVQECQDLETNISIPRLVDTANDRPDVRTPCRRFAADIGRQKAVGLPTPPSASVLGKVVVVSPRRNTDVGMRNKLVADTLRRPQPLPPVPAAAARVVARRTWPIFRPQIPLCAVNTWQRFSSALLDTHVRPEVGKV